MEIAEVIANVKADPRGATETALSAFKLDVVVDSCGVAISGPMDPVGSCSAQCGLIIHPENKQRIFVPGGLMDAQEQSKSVVPAFPPLVMDVRDGQRIVQSHTELAYTVGDEGTDAAVALPTGQGEL